MKIGIQTWGSTGDLRPFAALAAGLQSAGHQVHLVVTDIDSRDYRRYADEYEFRLTQVGTPVIAEVARLHEIADRCLRVNPYRQGRIIVEELFLPALKAMHQAACDLAEESDLLIGHSVLYPLQAEAERRAKPYATVALAPLLVPSRHVCPYGVPQLGEWGNRLFWWVARKLANRIFLPHVNALRLPLNLPPKCDAFMDVFTGGRLDLIASSEHLFARPADWPAHIHQCGFFDLPEASMADTVPPDLEAFLAAGAPPIFITFGSLTAADSAAFLVNVALFDRALQQTGHRAIVQLPAHDISGLPATPRFYFTSFVSHRRVFPRCAMVIHHGGAGTTHAVARSGVPALVVAHAADQFFWGDRCHRAGVAPAMLEMRSLTADKLARAISSISASDEMRRAAVALAQNLQSENGVANAVRLIEAEFS